MGATVSLHYSFLYSMSSAVPFSCLRVHLHCNSVATVLINYPGNTQHVFSKIPFDCQCLTYYVYVIGHEFAF